MKHVVTLLVTVLVDEETDGWVRGSKPFGPDVAAVRILHSVIRRWFNHKWICGYTVNATKPKVIGVRKADGV